MLASQKNEPQTSSTGLATRLRGSPLKSQHLNKFEDYNDSGYGGSPLPAPSLPPRRSTWTSSQVQQQPAINPTNHRLVDVFFLTPVLCSHCRDYIWGTGKVGVKCEGKSITFIYKNDFIFLILSTGCWDLKSANTSLPLTLWLRSPDVYELED